MADDITVDVDELAQVGWDTAAQQKVSTAFRHLLEVIRAESEKTVRTEAPKLTISLTGTYTQKGGAGGGVTVSVTF